MLNRYRNCVDDCDKAISLDPQYARAHVRRAKALIELGQFADATSGLARAHQSTTVQAISCPQSPEVLMPDTHDPATISCPQSPEV